MLLALAASLLSPPDHVPVAVAESGAEAVSAHLLSEADNARIVGRSLGPSMNSRHAYKAIFWERPEPAAADANLCIRLAHRISFDPSGPASQWRPEVGLGVRSRDFGPEFATVFPDEATTERCAEAAGWVPAGDQSEAVSQYMARLVDAVEAARGAEELQFRLACRPEAKAECAEARQILATLPLDRLNSIHLESDNYEMVVTDQGATVRPLTPDREGRWPRAVFSFESDFGVSQPWMVTVSGPEELEGVLLKRITLVRF